MRVRWMGEFAALVTAETRRLMPGVSVEHNYANAIAGGPLLCSTEQVNAACDYTGGDLYNHSFTAKYYYSVTQNQPFEYMTCRCDKALKVHTNSKTEEHLAVEVMLTAAHHGASLRRGSAGAPPSGRPPPSSRTAAARRRRSSAPSSTATSTPPP